MRRAILFFLILAAAVSLSGCNTLKGAADGFTKNVSATWKKANKTDAWLQQNAW